MTETFSPQLNNPTFLASASDEFLVQSIANGRPGTKMSAFGATNGGPLSDAQILLIVAHLRQWQPVGLPAPEPVTGRGDAAPGKPVYEATCAACHGTDGRSDTAPDLANPELQAVADDAFLRYAILRGRPGTTMVPANLSEQEMADVIAYIRTLGQP